MTREYKITLTALLLLSRCACSNFWASLAWTSCCVLISPSFQSPWLRHSQETFRLSMAFLLFLRESNGLAACWAAEMEILSPLLCLSWSLSGFFLLDKANLSLSYTSLHMEFLCTNYLHTHLCSALSFPFFFRYFPWANNVWLLEVTRVAHTFLHCDYFTHEICLLALPTQF